MKSWNRTELIDRLNRLSLPKKITFSAACAARLLPSYRHFNEETGRGNLETLLKAMRLIWSAVFRSPEPSLVQQIHEEVEALIPDYDDVGPALPPCADACVYAILHALSLLHGANAADAADSANQVFDGLRETISDRTEGAIFDERTEREILADPLMQQELDRQDRDLADLESGLDSQLPDLVNGMRARADSEDATSIR